MTLKSSFYAQGMTRKMTVNITFGAINITGVTFGLLFLQWITQEVVYVTNNSSVHAQRWCLVSGFVDVTFRVNRCSHLLCGRHLTRVTCELLHHRFCWGVCGITPEWYVSCFYAGIVVVCLASHQSDM